MCASARLQVHLLTDTVCFFVPLCARTLAHFLFVYVTGFSCTSAYACVRLVCVRAHGVRAYGACVRVMVFACVCV